ncbi:hypothetical protein [Spiroplasma endosymbiont of Dactylopius coccus]
MKTWIKTNLNKITLALALTGAISGVTGLTIGSLAHHKTNDLQYYLGHQYNVYWGVWNNYMVAQNKWWTQNRVIFWN